MKEFIKDKMKDSIIKARREVAYYRRIELGLFNAMYYPDKPIADPEVVLWYFHMLRGKRLKKPSFIARVLATL